MPHTTPLSKAVQAFFAADNGRVPELIKTAKDIIESATTSADAMNLKRRLYPNWCQRYSNWDLKAVDKLGHDSDLGLLGDATASSDLDMNKIILSAVISGRDKILERLKNKTLETELTGLVSELEDLMPRISLCVAMSQVDSIVAAFRDLQELHRVGDDAILGAQSIQSLKNLDDTLESDVLYKLRKSKNKARIEESKVEELITLVTEFKDRFAKSGIAPLLPPEMGRDGGQGRSRGE